LKYKQNISTKLAQV